MSRWDGPILGTLGVSYPRSKEGERRRVPSDVRCPPMADSGSILGCSPGLIPMAGC